MKFVAISDTHGQHQKLNLPKGDVIIHAGDFCHFGKLNNLQVKVHVFGHIHESYGQEIHRNTKFINASNINSNKGLINQPIVFHFDSN